MLFGRRFNVFLTLLTSNGRQNNVVCLLGQRPTLTCEAAHVSNALKMTSTRRWLVNTLPPTTAASSFGLIIEPSGMMTWIGAKHPYKTV